MPDQLFAGPRSVAAVHRVVVIKQRRGWLARRYDGRRLHGGRAATGCAHRSDAGPYDLHSQQCTECAVLLRHCFQRWPASGADLASSERDSGRRHLHAGAACFDRWDGRGNPCPCRCLVHQFIHPRLLTVVPARSGGAYVGLARCIRGEWRPRRYWRAARLGRATAHEYRAPCRATSRGAKLSPGVSAIATCWC